MRLSALVVLAGCSSFISNQAASTTYRMVQQSMTAAKREPDVALARAALPAGVVQLSGLVLEYPDNRGFKELLADSVCAYAMFAYDDWEDASMNHRATDVDGLQLALASCVEHNLALLPTGWHATASSLAAATPRDAGALRWIGVATALAISVQPIANYSQIEPTIALLQRACALAPFAHEADGELVLGTLEAVLDRPTARGRFAAARAALGEGALVVDVMEAHAFAADDDAKAKLQRVLAADVTRWPDRRLANELARKKARRYLGAE